MSDKSDDPDDEPILNACLVTDPTYASEGTSSEDTSSPIDENSNDSSIPRNSKKPEEPIECETCSNTGRLTFYKQVTLPNEVEPVEIFKNFCENCKCFFGMCSKKVLLTYLYVNEDGALLCLSEKAEVAQSNNAVSHQSSIDEPDGIKNLEPSRSDVSTSFGEKNEDNGIDEKMDTDDLADQSEVPQKMPSVRKKPKKHAFAGKSKKSNWGNRKRTQRKSVPSQSSSYDADITTNSSTSAGPNKKESEILRSRTSNSSGKTMTTTSDEKRRGRPNKPPQKNTTESASTTTETHTRTLMKNFPPKTRESSCQTDVDLLVKSLYLQECYDQAIDDEFNQQIAIRLREQPLILKKQFLMMMKTIKEQEEEIRKFRELEAKYQLACAAMRKFGRSTRLNFSDSCRNIRADLVERKEEFKAHESEVAAIIRAEKTKYEEYKAAMEQKYEDLHLESSTAQSKSEYLEQDRNYERDRADHYLRARDVLEKERHAAVEAAETARKNLNDRLWLADNETCSTCHETSRMCRSMQTQMAEMQENSNKAITDRDDAVEKLTIFESAAQKLGKDLDVTKYERDTFRSMAENYKKDVFSLNQSIKEKEKQLLEQVAEIAAAAKSGTPRSLVCTPVYTERITPPEDTDISNTPPQRSPHMNAAASRVEKPLQKMVIQKIVEKKVPPPIASGFESWIPKGKLDTPAPTVPKSVSAFGVPLNPKQQGSNSKYGPCSQPNPWEKSAKVAASVTSNSLSEAISKVQAEQFVGGSFPSSLSSKSYREEIDRAMNARKRIGEPHGENQKDQKNASPAVALAPSVKKIKSDAAADVLLTKTSSSTAVSTPFSSKIPSPCTSVGSLSNLKKIPKLSEKPPQAEFAPALGFTEQIKDGSIPGLGLGKLDEDTKDKQKEETMKIKPAIIQPATPSNDALAKTKVHTNVQNKNQQTSSMKNSSTPSSQKRNQQTPMKNNSNSEPKKNKNATPKKKNNNRTSNRSESSFAQHAPWQRQQTKTPPESAWRQQPQYGIQSSSEKSFPIDIGLDRPWSDSRNGGRANESFSAPWHRTQATPFGNVPIQDNYVMGGHMSMPPQRYQPFTQQQQHPQQSFYQRDNNFYSSSRDFSPPQPSQQSRMYTPPPYGYSGNPNQNGGGGNPRSFYS